MKNVKLIKNYQRFARITECGFFDQKITVSDLFRLFFILLEHPVGSNLCTEPKTSKQNLSILSDLDKFNFFALYAEKKLCI